MRRRDFLGSLATLTAAGFARAQSRPSRTTAADPSSGRLGSFPPALTAGQPLRRLPTLGSRTPQLRATITAAPVGASLLPGVRTELWCFNGEYPGPVIRLVEGQSAWLDFRNRLALDSTIHWHGLAVPPDQDGSPMDPVPPGSDRVYAFRAGPGSAGTYWYHPHAHRTTTLQAAHGLVAPLVVVDPDDPLDRLPIADRILMVTSIALDANGQVAMSGMPAGMMTMATGELLVNGQKAPVLALPPGSTERWRILNATADRFLRLSLDGHSLVVVGTDGGLLGEPLAGANEWLLAPGQRVEVVVTVTRAADARFALRDLGYGGGMMAGFASELMTVRTTAAAPLEPVPVPTRLREIGSLGSPAATQDVLLSVGGMGMMGGSFLINGRTFDMNRVDFTSVVGRVERWNFTNATPMDHPMHIHGTQFQVASRTVRGIVTPAAYRAWLDTVNVAAGETVSIDVAQGMSGKRMVHCHILPHEDAGMMAVLDVRSS